MQERSRPSGKKKKLLRGSTTVPCGMSKSRVREGGERDEQNVTPSTPDCEGVAD